MINKKMILGLLTIGMLAAVASAGTWAFFSDTITTVDNTISTGTIILTADGAAAATTPFDIGLIVPGNSISAYPAGNLINGGTADGDLTGTINVVVNSGTVLPEDMKITAVIGTESVVLGVGANTVPSQKLVAGTSAPITISVDYPNTAVEQAGQGIEITSSATFVLKSNPAYTTI